MTEKELTQQLLDPKTRRTAFATLVGQESERLYWVVRHIVGRHDWADDAVQNTFIKAWAALDNFRADASLSTWLHRIAVNEALDTLRREQRHHNGEGDETALERTMADDFFDGDEAEQLLRQALETLPEQQRAVFSMRYYDDLAYKEISAITGTSEGGLKANYHHAVEKIKNFFSTHH